MEHTASRRKRKKGENGRQKVYQSLAHGTELSPLFLHILLPLKIRSAYCLAERSDKDRISAPEAAFDSFEWHEWSFFCDKKSLEKFLFLAQIAWAGYV